MAPVIEEGDMDILAAGKLDFLGVNYYASKCARFPDADKNELTEAKSNLSGKKGAMGAYEVMPILPVHEEPKRRYQRLGLDH